MSAGLTFVIEMAMGGWVVTATPRPFSLGFQICLQKMLFIFGESNVISSMSRYAGKYLGLIV